MMDEKPITCEQVDQAELDRKYVAGRLSESEAVAFEAHFFGCDRCWQLVRGGAGVRAALRPYPGAPAASSRRRWLPLAIAAGIGVLALGTWRVVGSREAGNRDGIRGTGDSLAVRAGFSNGAWRLAWPTVPGANSYRVRVSASDGRLLFARETSDTSLVIAVDSLPALHAALYLDLEGFDELRRPVARSPLTPLPRPANPP